MTAGTRTAMMVSGVVSVFLMVVFVRVVMMPILMVVFVRVVMMPF